MDQGRGICLTQATIATLSSSGPLRITGLERDGCPFLRFLLTVEPNHGPLQLALTSPRGTKAFLDAELWLGTLPA